MARRARRPGRRRSPHRGGWRRLDDRPRRPRRRRGRAAGPAGPPAHAGRILRSNTFTLTVTGAGRRVTRLVAEGSGSGARRRLLPVGRRGSGPRRPGLPADPRGILSGRRRSSGSTDGGTELTASRAMSEPLRVGIVGGGAMTQVAHLPVLKKLKRIEVAGDLRHATCRRRERSPTGSASRTRSTTSRSCSASKRSTPSSSATPNHLHESHILAALSRQPPRPGREAARDERGARAADHPRGGKARPPRHGGDEPPVPPRRADRPELRAERRARDASRASAAAGMCSGPAEPSWAGASGATSPAAARCSTSA